jgi:hypothetical protein
MNTSRFTYHEPKDKFRKINMDVILKYDPIIVGIYCKMVTLSAGKSLSIDFLSKKLNVGSKRMRKVIVFLEEEGYIVRTAIRDESGKMNGWNYNMYAEPVGKDERTKAGKKKDESPSYTDSRLVGSPSCPVSVKSENGQDNILSNTRVLSNNKDLSIDKDKEVLSNDNTKKEPVSKLSEEERIYEEKMRERFPRIMRMEQPLTLKQAKELKERYDPDMLADIMESMENWKKLKSQNVSAYKTIIKWCEKELDKL